MVYLLVVLLGLTVALFRKVALLTQVVDDLTAAVTRETAVVATAVAALGNVESPADVAAIQAAVTQINKNADDLAAAVSPASPSPVSAPSSVADAHPLRP
jgi:hypothetical protein